MNNRKIKLLQVAFNELDLAQEIWCDLPVRAYTPEYRKEYEDWFLKVIENRPELDEDGIKHTAIMCLHHLTGDRLPYF